MERKAYPESFKREAVGELELRGQRTALSVGEELGVKPKQLYNWRRKYTDTTAEAREERGEMLEQEVKLLRKYNRELQEERTV